MEWDLHSPDVVDRLLIFFFENGKPVTASLEWDLHSQWNTSFESVDYLIKGRPLNLQHIRKLCLVYDD